MLPYLFNSFKTLFKYFLFLKDFNIYKSKTSTLEDAILLFTSKALNTIIASYIEPI
jgi:hypothetical protein